MKKVLTVFIILCGFLTGCALSPQQIDVSPKVSVTRQDRHFRGELHVNVMDNRSSPSLGSRGGVYSKTNKIVTDADTTLSIQSSVELALRQMGFTIIDAESAPTLTVYLDRLTYHAPGVAYITKVDLSAQVRVVVVSQGKKFDGNYESKLSERVLAAPSDDKNKALVNQVLSDALTRAFSDQELLTYLETIPQH